MELPMTTQKSKSGRHATQDQRDFAGELLAQYDESRDVTILVDALRHFQRTGDFSPFSGDNQHLKKRAMFHRFYAHSNSLRGGQLDDYASAVAAKYGFSFSEETALKMIKGKVSNPARLTGSDALFEFIDQQLKKP
jgi:hypothetical protein